MRTEIVIACLNASLNVALWGALYHKLRALPLDVSKAAQRSRPAEEKRALDALQEAAASRIGGLVIGIRTYHEQLAGLVRAQLAEAEVRARVSERRSSEAGVALDAATVLVRDLRAIAEDLPSLFDRRALQTGIAIGEATARKDNREPSTEPDDRETVELSRRSTLPDSVPGDDDLTIARGQLLSGTHPRPSADEQDGAS